MAKIKDANKNEIKTDAEIFNMQKFAQMLIQRIKNPNKTNDSSTVAFSTYTKDNILNYLKSPTANVKSLKNASRQLFQNSIEYKRLVLYYAYMSLFAYVVSPVGFDSSKGTSNTSAFLKQYNKAVSQLERMNLRQELRKALVTMIVDGAAYGLIWENNSSWFIQYVDPDFCTITSLVDGCWVFSIDMSKIKEEDLVKYPDYVETMYAEYKNTGVKLQEVPEEHCFCIKADESVSYPIPFFAGIMPSVYDLESYKSLAEVATKLDIFKLISFKIPTDDKGVPSIDWDTITKFYDLLANNVPEAVGVAALPGEVNSVDFKKSESGNSTTDISDAIQNFYYTSGTSSLLFGDAANNTSGALAMSIKADEEIVFAFMAQCERVVNRLLKSLSGTQKFKITFLPATIFSKEKEVGYIKEAATLGLPTKSAYAALMHVQQIDIGGMSYVENDVLKLQDVFIPLSSTYTQSSAGRPASNTDTPSESKEATDATDQNANGV